MNTAFTLILPHKLNPGNDEALAICLDMLVKNTSAEFALVMDVTINSPLNERINRMIEHAYTDCVVFWNSDMFAAPGWDVPMLRCHDYWTIVNPVLVEPGAISMSGENLQKDFGRKPSTFRRVEFEAWAQRQTEDRGGEGWYAPFMISRNRWLDLGGLETDGPILPNGLHRDPMDIRLYERHKASSGRVVRGQRSFVYHLQRWSDLDEQMHEKRERSS